MDRALTALLALSPTQIGALDRVKDSIAAELKIADNYAAVVPRLTGPADGPNPAVIRGESGRLRSRRWLRPGLVAAVLAGALVIASGPTAPPAAAANWAAVPSPVSATSFAALQTECQKYMGSSASAVVAERRGTSTYTVLADTSQCLRYGVPQRGIPSYLASGGQEDPQTATVPLPTNNVLVIGAGSGGEIKSGTSETPAKQTLLAGYQRLFGRAGSGVIGVVVHRSNGSDVVATVQNGWFVAWWPGDDESSSITVSGAFGHYERTATFGM